MRKILSVILLAFCLYNCSSDSEDSAKTGDIHGTITEKSSAEPMKATGVELYIRKFNDFGIETEPALLLKTVTYDDGRYEFNELNPELYKLKVVAEGYNTATYDVEVEAGRTAQADMQLSKKIPAIYGIVTAKNSATPIKGAGVEVYSEFYGTNNRNNILETKTVTSESGQYEFDELQPKEYTLNVVAEGYKNITQKIKVETEKTARADIQLEKIKTGLTVSVSSTELSRNKKEALLKGKYTYTDAPDNVGFFYAQAADFLSKSDNITGTFNGAGNFFATIRNLKKGIYYIQAYAKNSRGTELSEIVQLEITGDPVVTTLAATNVSGATATLNGKIEYPGEPVYTEKGFVYSASFPNPTIDDPKDATTKVSITGKSEEFSANIANLTENAIYYVRTYVIWEDKVIYGESMNFKAASETAYYILESASLMVQKNDLSSGADWETASSLCKSSTLGGYTDWRLPTRGELQEIYDNQNIIGQLSGWYWSKDKYNNDFYYYFNMSTGGIYDTFGDRSYKVRAVRSIAK